MNCSGKYPIILGLLSILISTSSLSGQASSGDGARAALPNAAPPLMQTQTDAGAKLHDDSYVIGNGDILAISVWKDADLSRTIPVRSDGKISLPLIGEVQAAAQTPLGLEQVITERLRNYITTPEVTVMVEQVNSKKFNILGQVTRPGSYALALATTVMDAVAAAGGLKDFAKSKNIYVLRQKQDGSQLKFDFNYKDFVKGKNLAQNIKLQPNDTVIVP
jgi:polysaccharide export outer membrane protein